MSIISLIVVWFFYISHVDSILKYSSKNEELESGIIKIAKPPYEKYYKLKYPNGINNGYWSQLGQDKCALKLLNNMVGGYFVEAGGYDGELHSNSLYLEKNYQWNGILIEPNPYLFRKIRQLHRNCSVINAGISMNGSTTSIPFRLGGPLGGFVSEFSAKHNQRIDKNIAEGHEEFKDESGMGKVKLVPVTSLKEILQLDENKNMIIDFFSLDTEGSEPNILASINFSEILIGVIIVEHNNLPNNIKRIRSIMTKQGFKEIVGNGQDSVFYNPKYFSIKGIPLPNDRLGFC